MEVFNPFEWLTKIEKITVENDMEKVTVVFEFKEPVNNITKIVAHVYTYTPEEAKHTLTEAFYKMFGYG